jgi:hypothetical protein
LETVIPIVEEPASAIEVPSTVEASFTLIRVPTPSFKAPTSTWGDASTDDDPFEISRGTAFVAA